MNYLINLLVALTLVAAAGCGSAGRTVNTRSIDLTLGQTVGSPGTTNAIDSPPEERFVFVATGMEQARYDSIQQFLGASLNGMDGGDVLHIVSTPGHEPVVSIHIPDGNLRARQKSPQFARAVRKIKGFLEQCPHSPLPAQLDMPLVSRTVNQLRQLKEHVTIYGFGDPVYSPQPQRAWSFTDHCVPSDAALWSDRCPFGPVERVPLSTLQGKHADVYFIAPSSQWGDSAEHRQSIERFYRLYVHELEGVFHGVFLDVESLPSRSNTQRASEPSLPAVRDHSFVGMWSTRQEQVRTAFESTATEVAVAVMPAPVHQERVQPEGVNASITPPVPQLLDQYLRELPPDKMAVSIRWLTVGDGSQSKDSDLDLWILDRNYEGHELNFRNMQTGFGRLYRDIRHEVENEDFTKWEYAEVSHDRLEDLDVWIDCYKATGNLKCTVCVAWHGTVREMQVSFQDVHGDGAADHMRRETSPAWRHLSLEHLFSNPKTN